MSKSQAMDDYVLCGGRAAEELIFGDDQWRLTILSVQQPLLALWSRSIYMSDKLGMVTSASSKAVILVVASSSPALKQQLKRLMLRLGGGC